MRKPRKLKASTLKAYNGKLLLNHLDNLMDHFVDPPFRINLSTNELYELNDNAYFYLCSDQNRYMIISCIESAYKDLFQH